MIDVEEDIKSSFLEKQISRRLGHKRVKGQANGYFVVPTTHRDKKKFVHLYQCSRGENSSVVMDKVHLKCFIRVLTEALEDITGNKYKLVNLSAETKTDPIDK